MKKSVLISGVVLLLFFNICNAKEAVSVSSAIFQNTILLNDTTNVQSNKPRAFEKPSLAEEVEVYNPERIIAYSPKTVKEIIEEGDRIVNYPVSDNEGFINSEESMKEVIAQGELIIERKVSDLMYPLYIEKSIDDEIAELELIIDSKETNKESPLDFNKINKNSMLVKSSKAKQIIGMN